MLKSLKNIFQFQSNHTKYENLTNLMKQTVKKGDNSFIHPNFQINILLFGSKPEVDVSGNFSEEDLMSLSILFIQLAIDPKLNSVSII